MLTNHPTVLRRRLHALFASQPLTLGDQVLGQEVTDEAIEEVIAAAVRGYLGDDGPTACERVTTALFLSLLQRQE